MLGLKETKFLEFQKITGSLTGKQALNFKVRVLQDFMKNTQRMRSLIKNSQRT